MCLVMRTEAEDLIVNPCRPESSAEKGGREILKRLGHKLGEGARLGKVGLLVWAKNPLPQKPVGGHTGKQSTMKSSIAPTS